MLGSVLRNAAMGLGVVALAAGSRSPVLAQTSGDPVVLNVLQPMSGPGGGIGQTDKPVFEAMEKFANQEGGIKGRRVKFQINDDQTNPQVAVQIVRRLQADPHTNVILGSSLSTICNAAAALVKSNGPVLYCYSPSFYPEAGGYAFGSLITQEATVEQMVRYFHNRGWNRIALITTTDNTGQAAEKAADKTVTLPEFKDMKIVERVQFNPQDLSVAGQVQRIKSAGPQAVIAWLSGAPFGTLLKGFAQADVDIPTGVGTANMTYVSMERYGSILPKQLYFSANLGSVSGDGLKLDPELAEQGRKFAAQYQSVGLKRDSNTESLWDANWIVINALRQIGPDAPAKMVRDHILNISRYVGVSGIYDFKADPNRGIGSRDAVMARWNPKLQYFEVMSQPGGAPIDRPPLD